jgi:hypothetical protein
VPRDGQAADRIAVGATVGQHARADQTQHGPSRIPGCSRFIRACVGPLGRLDCAQRYFGNEISKTSALAKPASWSRSTCACAWSLVGNSPLATATKK